MTRVVIVLRWFLVLPVALISTMIALFPLHWVLYNTLQNFVTPYPANIERFLSPLASCFGLVCGGVATAPSHKVIVSWVLFVLTLVMVSVLTALSSAGAIIGNIQLSPNFNIISPICSVIGAGAGVALTYFRRSEDNQEHTADK